MVVHAYVISLLVTGVIGNLALAAGIMTDSPKLAIAGGAVCALFAVGLMFLMGSVQA